MPEIPSVGETRDREEDDRYVEFKTGVTINDLPYTFSGRVPSELVIIEHGSFQWYLRVLDRQSELKEADQQLQTSTITEIARKRLSFFSRWGGVAGMLNVDGPIENKDITISGILSTTRYLTEESTYRDARGVGSFFLNNLLALADLRRWRVYALPFPDEDEEFQKKDLIDWYTRHGFSFEGGRRHLLARMVRQPREADSTQVIAQLLKKRPETKLEGHEGLPANINKLGVLVHGVDSEAVKKLRTILLEGLKPRAAQEKPQQRFTVTPNDISLSMVGKRGYKGTSAFLWGANEQPFNSALTLMIDPEYVKRHIEEFQAVGYFFAPGYPSRKLYCDSDGQLPNGFEYNEKGAIEYDNEVYGDEVLASFILPEAIVGIIANLRSVEAVRHELATNFPKRRIIIYDIEGNILNS